MFNGKNKALTFSFDDGTTQDIRLIEILNRYGLKATFNLNSQLFEKAWQLERNGKMVSHNKIKPDEVANIYKGHEVAAHTLTHQNLTMVDDAEIIRQVEEDREILSKLCGYEVVGMAYPCGGTNNNDHVAEVIRQNTKIKYARTIASNGDFSLQSNLLRFNPTVDVVETDAMFKLAERFLKAQSSEPMIFYVWGHSFELDAYDAWERFEEFCRLMGEQNDIFFGTNKEVLLYGAL